MAIISQTATGKKLSTAGTEATEIAPAPAHAPASAPAPFFNGSDLRPIQSISRNVREETDLALWIGSVILLSCPSI